MASAAPFATSSATATFATLSTHLDASKSIQGQARAKAEDFEAVFLNTMFTQMFTGADGEGPLGGGPAVGVWRSFLTQEYAKSFAKSGGIGIADHVYRSLIAQQEAR